MIDTLATAQTLTKAGLQRAHAEAITTAVNQASEQVTRGDLSALEVRLAAQDQVTRTDIAALGTDIAALEVRFVKWTIAIAGLQTALVFGIVRFFH